MVKVHNNCSLFVSFYVFLRTHLREYVVSCITQSICVFVCIHLNSHILKECEYVFVSVFKPILQFIKLPEGNWIIIGCYF